MSLVEVFDALRQDARLAGIQQFYGAPHKDALATVPKIVWAPSTDSYEGPDMGDPLVPIPQAAPVTILGQNANGGVEYAPQQGVEGATVTHYVAGPSFGLLVTVDAKAVNVRLATSAAGAITSTAAQVVAAVQAHGAAAALVMCQAMGDGSGVVRDSPRQKLRATATRVAGCELHIWADDHTQLESILNKLHGALWWNLRSSLRRGAGEHARDENNSTAAVGYIQDIAVEVPIYDELPAAQVHTTSTSATPTR